MQKRRLFGFVESRVALSFVGAVALLLLLFLDRVGLVVALFELVSVLAHGKGIPRTQEYNRAANLGA